MEICLTNRENSVLVETAASNRAVSLYVLEEDADPEVVLRKLKFRVNTLSGVRVAFIGALIFFTAFSTVCWFHISTPWFLVAMVGVAFAFVLATGVWTDRRSDLRIRGTFWMEGSPADYMELTDAQANALVAAQDDNEALGELKKLIREEVLRGREEEVAARKAAAKARATAILRGDQGSSRFEKLPVANGGIKLEEFLGASKL